MGQVACRTGGLNLYSPTFDAHVLNNTADFLRFVTVSSVEQLKHGDRVYD